MDVIQFHDVTGREMVGRWPVEGTRDVRIGSQLIVEEHQRAIFVREGRALDTFGPGRHTLTTRSLPLVSQLLRLPFGTRSPFQAAVVFTSARTFLDLKWGTKEPVVFRDRELAMVRLRAFGKYAIRVVNPQLFVNTLVGSRGLYETTELEGYFKDVITARLNDLLGETHSSVLELAALYDELAMGLKSRVTDDFGRFGIELVELVIGAITPPPEVQQMIDERSGMAAVGDVDAYMRFKAARAMGDAARAPEGTGSALGTGAGIGLGMMLPQMMQSGPPTADASKPAARDAAPSDGSATRFCHQCGASLPESARFCPACGTSVA
ncbi:MAG: SPFH domain-containing protein [Acidobacteriota bacterium]